MSDTPEPARQWKHWAEWKRRCALGACDIETQAALRGFAHHRFHLQIHRAARRVDCTLAAAVRRTLGEAEAWHLFECQLLVKSTRGGKQYKEWLFARVSGADAAALRGVDAGATLIMRDVAREHLRRECASAGQTSLNAPLAADGAPLTLVDLLPGTGEDPAGQAARAEYPALAAAIARETLAAMDMPLRVVLCAKALGVSLADPVVEQMAGRGKSTLSADFARFRAGLREQIAIRHADEGPDGTRELLYLAVTALQEHIFLWAKSEKTCRGLFGCRGTSA